MASASSSSARRRAADRPPQLVGDARERAVVQRVVEHQVAVGGHAPDQVRVGLCPHAGNAKAGDDVLVLQDVEDVLGVPRSAPASNVKATLPGGSIGCDVGGWRRGHARPGPLAVGCAVAQGRWARRSHGRRSGCGRWRVGGRDGGLGWRRSRRLGRGPRDCRRLRRLGHRHGSRGGSPLAGGAGVAVTRTTTVGSTERASSRDVSRSSRGGHHRAAHCQQQHHQQPRHAAPRSTPAPSRPRGSGRTTCHAGRV